MSEKQQLLDLRRDYDRLAQALRQAERHHQTVQSQLQRAHGNIALLQADIQSLHEQHEQLAQLVRLQESQLVQRGDALLYAEDRCVSAEENLYRLELEVQRLPAEGQRILELETALKDSYKETEEVTEIATAWKEKCEQLQQRMVLANSQSHTNRQAAHPLVLRLQEMVRDCRGLDLLPSAKESWSWVKKVVELHMVDRKK